MRVLWVEMDTQLNCQSRQTNTKLILVWKRAIAGGRGCPGLLERNIPPWDGNDSETPSTEHRSHRGLGAPGHPPHWPQGRAEISLSQAFLPRLCRSPFPCQLGALGGPAGCEGPWHSPGEPAAGAASPCHPFPCAAPVPGQESPNRPRITLSPPKKSSNQVGSFKEN